MSIVGVRHLCRAQRREGCQTYTHIAPPTATGARQSWCGFHRVAQLVGIAQSAMKRWARVLNRVGLTQKKHGRILCRCIMETRFPSRVLTRRNFQRAVLVRFDGAHHLLVHVHVGIAVAPLPPRPPGRRRSSFRGFGYLTHVDIDRRHDVHDLGTKIRWPCVQVPDAHSVLVETAAYTRYVACRSRGCSAGRAVLVSTQVCVFRKMSFPLGNTRDARTLEGSRTFVA